MPIAHSSQIETSISRLRETAYGVARGSGDDFRRIISESPGVATETLAFEDDAAYENGSDLAIETWATTAETSIEISPKLNFQDIGYQLDRALGGYAVSGAGPYTHVFTPQSMNTSRQLPSSTFIKKYGGLRTMVYPGMVCSQLTITGNKSGRLSTSQSFMGSGNRLKNPAGYTSPVITSDREYAYGGQAVINLHQAALGTRQVETITLSGTVTTAGTAQITLTAAGLPGSPIVTSVNLVIGDTAVIAAAKLRDAMRSNTNIALMFEIPTNATGVIQLIKRAKAANDATLAMAFAGSNVGITAGLSVDTTAGVLGSSQIYSCALESWAININNPSADDGYRQCSPYIEPGVPESGQMRSEYLVGVRDYTFTFQARDDGTDKLEDWMRAGTIVDLDVPIFGVEANDASLRFTHSRARVIQANPITGAGGDFIGIDGSIRLLAAAAGDGSIPFTATLINGVVSYAS